MSATKQVGAFFDLDGTLQPSPSVEREFLRYAFSRGRLGPRQLLRWAARFAASFAVDFHAATHGNKAYFAGMPAAAVAEWQARLASRPLRFFSAGMQLLEWHAARGHRIYLVTGAPAPLAEIVARRLPAPSEIMATELEESCGRWTGGISGEHMRGAAKRSAIERIAAKEGVDLARSFAYGDSYSDVPMLESVAFPAVVNPGELLGRLAQNRGWPILEWHATVERSFAAPRQEARMNFQRRIKLLSLAKPSLGVNR
jgi:HAD superfamily hydrolase (TIGR01490 family)